MHPTTTTTAHAVLNRLADLVIVPHAGGVQPEGRAAAIAATLRELAEIPAARDLPLSPATLAYGLRLLSRPFPGESLDEPMSTKSRRATCDALAFWAEHTDMISSVERGTLYLGEMLAVWRAVSDHLRVVAGDDPRLSAMAGTYDREAHELYSWVKVGDMRLDALMGALGRSIADADREASDRHLAKMRRDLT